MEVERAVANMLRVRGAQIFLTFLYCPQNNPNLHKKKTMPVTVWSRCDGICLVSGPDTVNIQKSRTSTSVPPVTGSVLCGDFDYFWHSDRKFTYGKLATDRSSLPGVTKTVKL